MRASCACACDSGHAQSEDFAKVEKSVRHPSISSRLYFLVISQVVESTIDTIVPALVSEQKAAAASNKPGGSPSRRTDRVVPVIAIFVDALDHIPKHRSLKLFVKLLTTLGSSK